MFSAAVFDLDGTLFDTCQKVYGALRITLSDAGLDAISEESFRPYMAVTLDMFFQEHYGMKREDALAMVPRFRKEYAEICVESEPFPGIRDMLNGLGSVGIKIGVATNKGNSLANSMIDSSVLKGLFSAVIGAEDNTITPKALTIRKCLRTMFSEPGSTVYIGDCISDYRAASTAGLAFIGVSYGYGFKTAEERKGIRMCNCPNDIFREIVGDNTADEQYN